jgi:hypothetical protein
MRRSFFNSVPSNFDHSSVFDSGQGVTAITMTNTSSSPPSLLLKAVLVQTVVSNLGIHRNATGRPILWVSGVTDCKNVIFSYGRE